ncbi:MAG: L-threonylcarbamoyladenylate synthase [Oscillospiraceae bacterium]|nr:L-threonylcarbamoyladenylate synthase [Oscillospiraceae bacterium]
MRTLLLTPGDIETAAELIRQGELVAVPTETVYGLAANALDTAAVNKIFTAKGRPQDNPLIVHISDRRRLPELVTHIPDDAVKLMDAFWPGALTMVFGAAACVPSAVTAGLPTVAVRFPGHPVMLELIKAAGVPLAAPSGNRSGLPSPTLAGHVLDDLDGKIAAVIDGGPCEIGVESTVLDMTGGTPCILRLGGVSRADIERVMGKSVTLDTHSEKPRSPGQKYRHYAPVKPLAAVSAPIRDERGIVVICPEEQAHLYSNAIIYGQLSQPETLARGLYAALREADKTDADRIVAVCPDGEAFDAVRDRLRRAEQEHTT